MNLKKKRIIISKANQIGDVICALPLASAIKQLEPSATTIFLGREYTRSLIEHYPDVDEFADWEAMIAQGEEKAAQALRQLKADIILQVMPNRPSDVICRVAKKAGIPIRVGTSHRLYTWKYCNRFVNVGRSKSPLHETQLDMMFMRALGGQRFYSLQDIIALRHFLPFPKNFSVLQELDKKRFNIILHPKTRGEFIEWSPELFGQLIALLPNDQFKIFVTGSEAEGKKVREKMINPFPQVIDLCGKLSLLELMSFIQSADGLVCASTGPVHLAAAFGIHTLGLYAPIQPFHAGRWGPVGIRAESMTIPKKCEACRHRSGCQCILAIRPEDVYGVLSGWRLGKEP